MMNYFKKNINSVKILLPLLLLVLIVSLSIFFNLKSNYETLKPDEIVFIDNVAFKKFTSEPYTGFISGTEEGKYIDGRKHGRWITYHENGVIGLDINYKEGKYFGPWKAYRINGNLWAEGNFNSKNIGTMKEYNYDGRLKGFGPIIDPLIKNGIWEDYIYEFEGNLNMAWNYNESKYMNIDKSIGAYLDNCRVNEWNFYSKSKLKQTIIYLPSCKKHNFDYDYIGDTKYKEYYQNNFNRYNKIQYFDNGNKSYEDYNIPDGDWTGSKYYYKNGNNKHFIAASDISKTNPAKHTKWYENGELKSRGGFYSGKQGKWEYYNKDGTLESEVIYEDGKIIDTSVNE